MVSWFKDKEDFYGMTTKPEENVIETKFESGKSRYTLMNQSPKLTHQFSFLLKNKADEQSFWYWYSNILLSRTQTVELTDLVSHEGLKEYRMISEPAVQDSQYPKEVQIEVKEE